MFQKRPTTSGKKDPGGKNATRKSHSEEASQSGSPDEEASWAAPSQHQDGEAGLSTFEFNGPAKGQAPGLLGMCRLTDDEGNVVPACMWTPNAAPKGAPRTFKILF